MLLKREILERIASGDVSLAFRRWRRPTVKPGGTLRTAVGVLSIARVDRITASDITRGDAARAGYADREQLLAELAQREGDLYRIELALAGPDPRIELRNQSQLTDDEIQTILARLSRLDARSSVGAWTAKTLRLIAQQPGTPAGELAARLGFDKAWLKVNVRKLKELGLTESLQPGYRLSPRGEALLARL